jgi:hypothetical protein
MNSITFKKVDAKRTEVEYNGFDMKTLESSKLGGNCIVVMPNRSIQKDTDNVTIYLDLSEVSMKDVYASAAENWKTRATQAELKKLSEAERAKIFKDGFWHIRIADWLVEKQTATSKNALDKVKGLLGKLSAEEKAELKKLFQ